MGCRVIAFAQAREWLGFSEREVEVLPQETGRGLVSALLRERSRELPPTWKLALDEQWVGWDAPIGTAREIAVMPPFSGG